MSSDIDPADVRILYSHPHCLVLGPLGRYWVGQKLELPKYGTVEITSIDPDGAGLGRTLEQMEAKPQEGWHPGFCTSYGADWASPQVHEWMLDQQARNRREHGVVLPPGEIARRAA